MSSSISPTPLSEPLYQYVLAVGMREPDVFRELREETAQLPEGGMQIAPEQGPFLAMLVQLMGAKTCLEVGTFTGYSAAWVAGVLPDDGRLICCEIDETFAAIARKFWGLAGVRGKIDLRMGPALDVLNQ